MPNIKRIDGLQGINNKKIVVIINKYKNKNINYYLYIIINFKIIGRY